MRKVKRTVPVLMTEPTFCPQGRGTSETQSEHERQSVNFHKGRRGKRKNQGKSSDKRWWRWSQNKSCRKSVIWSLRRGGLHRGAKAKGQAGGTGVCERLWVSGPPLGHPSAKAPRQQAHPHWTVAAVLEGKKKCTWSERWEIFSTQTSGQLILSTSSGAVRERGRLAGTVAWGGHKGSPCTPSAFCFMATCPHLQGEMNQEAVFLLAWNKWPVEISGLIWPFGSNQWPRNRNSLVLISSRAVTIIGGGGLHQRGSGGTAASLEKTPTGLLCPPCLWKETGVQWVVQENESFSPPPHFLNRGLDTWAQDAMASLMGEEVGSFQCDRQARRRRWMETRCYSFYFSLKEQIGYSRAHLKMHNHGWLCCCIAETNITL